MAAMELDWIPQSLHCIAATVVANDFARWRLEVRSLPRILQFDVYHKLYQQGKLCRLGTELCDLGVFSRMLQVAGKQLSLHHCFQAIRDHGIKISEVLSGQYCYRVSNLIKKKCDCSNAIVTGFQLGGFLSDAGWNSDAAKVFSSCFEACLIAEDLEKAFCCCTRLLHVYNANCMYNDAKEQFHKAQDLYQMLKQRQPDIVVNLASLFAEYGAYHFAKSEYNKAYRWSIEALKMLKKPGNISQAAVIDVMRLASKACVIKRQFLAAERLVKFAVLLSKETFGHLHPRYSSTLLDYGFYLLNVDNVCQSQKVYQTALAIRQNAFGGQNLHVAVAHEDLAYASYVHQYSTGRFEEARSHADAAINILSKILPNDHLLLASSNRVKALILEEIAIDSVDLYGRRLLLEESHSLHLQSLELARKAFGEQNVQTAKHYGNLGRLYQSMELYEKAEEMHLKAIFIKELLLGPHDYEVALSVGHLASLYNYDLKQYDKAECLYLRSIAIAKRLFGDGYSGLEYDYRGLIKLYSRTGDFEKKFEYDHILSEWNMIREHRYTGANNDPHDLENINPRCDGSTNVTETIESVVDDFFSKLDADVDCMHQSYYEDAPKPRTASDIAFGGPLTSVSSRAPPRGNDHRNVGDGTFSHAAVSTPQGRGALKIDHGETRSLSMPNLALTGHCFDCDDDIVQALTTFGVIPGPRISHSLLKMKLE